MKKTVWEIIYNGIVNYIFAEEPITEIEARRRLREMINNG